MKMEIGLDVLMIAVSRDEFGHSVSCNNLNLSQLTMRDSTAHHMRTVRVFTRTPTSMSQVSTTIKKSEKTTWNFQLEQ